MHKPSFYDMAAWLHEHDLASKLEGWLITNDSDNLCCIAKLDDPSSMAGTPGWPKTFTEPQFATDDEAIEFVRRTAKAGSQWHAQAIAIHDARIPLSLWIPDSTRVIVVVEGGLVQTIFADRPLNVDVLDHDNWEVTDRTFDPETWQRFADLAQEIDEGQLLEQVY